MLKQVKKAPKLAAVPAQTFKDHEYSKTEKTEKPQTLSNAECLLSLYADLHPETLCFVLHFSNDRPAFHGQGYALPAVEVLSSTLWPVRLGVCCDDIDRLFGLSGEEAASIEPRLWVSSGKRLVDAQAWEKMKAFASVKQSPEEATALTVLYDVSVTVFKALTAPAAPAEPVPVPGSGPQPHIEEPKPKPKPAPPAAPVPEPETRGVLIQELPPSPPTAGDLPPMPARKFSYWSLQGRSMPIRVGIDAEGGLWVARLDLEGVLGEEGTWPYDCRDKPARKVANGPANQTLYAAVSEELIPPIVLGMESSIRPEGMKFARWWSENVQPSALGTAPVIHRIWPIGGERPQAPAMPAKKFDFVYNNRRMAVVFVAKDERGGLWIKRAELDHVYGPLSMWPIKAKNAPRELIEWDGSKYPAISAVTLPILARAQTQSGAKLIAQAFEDMINGPVTAEFLAPVPPAPPAPEPSAEPALEGEHMTFAYRPGQDYDVIVAIDEKDHLWVTLLSLEVVFGQTAPNWPRATRCAPVKDILYKGARCPAIQDIWLDDIAAAQPAYRRARAEGFVNWWLDKVESEFHPDAKADKPAAPAPDPMTELQQALVPAPTSSASVRAKEVASLLLQLAQEVDAKDREIAQLKAELAARAKADKAKAEQIQAAFDIINKLKL